MIKEIKIYECSDGKRWDKSEDAKRYEETLSKLSSLENKLRLPEKLTQNTYFKHDEETILFIKKKFIEICIQMIPFYKELFELYEKQNLEFCYLCKVLDDYKKKFPCLFKFYKRLLCIDRKGREFFQPYYTFHPELVKREIKLWDPQN